MKTIKSCSEVHKSNRKLHIYKKLTSYQDKCCHVALAVIEIWIHFQEAVKLLTAYSCHVILVPFSAPNWKKDKQQNPAI